MIESRPRAREPDDQQAWVASTSAKPTSRQPASTSGSSFDVRGLDVDRHDVDHSHGSEERRDTKRPTRTGAGILEQRGIPPTEPGRDGGQQQCAEPDRQDEATQHVCATVDQRVVTGPGEQPDHPDQHQVPEDDMQHRGTWPHCRPQAAGRPTGTS